MTLSHEGVWVLVDCGWEEGGEEVVGVYATEEEARAAGRLRPHRPRWRIFGPAPYYASDPEVDVTWDAADVQLITREHVAMVEAAREALNAEPADVFLHASEGKPHAEQRIACVVLRAAGVLP